MLAPLAGLALAVTAGLAGCGAGQFPTPTGSPSASVSAQPTPTAEASEPTTVESLPGGALMRVSVTAVSGGSEVRLVLTFDRPAVKTTDPDAFETVTDACPNAIASQLGAYPGLELTGVLTSHLETSGDWPEGATVAVAAGGLIASIGEGTDVAPTEDPVGLFGCTVPVVTGPRDATFTSLLLGDPSIVDREDLETQIAHGVYGIETDASSGAEIEWRDCVIQLSSTAKRLASANAWVPPAQWGDGCLIGDDGTV